MTELAVKNRPRVETPSDGPPPTPARRVRWGRVALIAIPVLLIAIIAYNKIKERRETQAPTTVASVAVGPENVAVVAMGELQMGPALSGTLTPERDATLRAELSGAVVQTYVEQGERVRRGQLLARIDASAIQENVLSARSAARAAKIALDNAQRDYERNQRLEQAGAIAPRDLESSQRALASAQAGAADAEARLSAAEKQLAQTQIRAPFDGVVSNRAVSAGDIVQPGTAMVSVVDPSSMKLEASVPSDQLEALHVGAPVRFTVNGYPGRVFTGKVTRVNPTADPVTRQVPITVSIPNEGSALVGGLFAQGRVATESRRGLLVPTSALDERGITPMVVRIKGGKAERVPVQEGLRDTQIDRVEITAGVAAGDTLLLGAAQGVNPGTVVRVVPVREQ